MKESLGFSGEEVNNVAFQYHLVEGHMKKLDSEVSTTQHSMHYDSNPSVYWVIIGGIYCILSWGLGADNLVLGAAEGFHDQKNCKNCLVQPRESFLKESNIEAKFKCPKLMCNQNNKRGIWKCCWILSPCLCHRRRLKYPLSHEKKASEKSTGIQMGGYGIALMTSYSAHTLLYLPPPPQ